KFLLGRLGNLDKNALFAKLERLLDKHGLVPSVHSFEMDMTIMNLESEVDDFFSLIGQYFSKQRTKQKRLSKLQFRMNDTIRNSAEWAKDGPITVCSERIIASLDLIQTAMEDRLSLIQNHVKKIPDMDKAFLEELNGFLQSWIEIGEKIKAFIIQPP